MKKTRLFTFLVASLFTLAISAQGIVVHQGNSKQVSFQSKDVQKIEFTENQVENSTDNYVEKSELDDLLDKLRDEINKKVDASEAEEIWSKIKSILESITQLDDKKADRKYVESEFTDLRDNYKTLSGYYSDLDKNKASQKDIEDAIAQARKDCESLIQENGKGIKKNADAISSLGNDVAGKASQSELNKALDKIDELSKLVNELQKKIDAGGGSGETGNMENGHEFVDLGLSVKWANMNVGATEVAGSKTNSHTGQLDCYGEYYVWGETSPKDTYSSSSFFDSSYSKYNINGGKTTLELTDDAASANWGGSWRMPTYAEQKELFNNCYWEWTTSYNNSGVKGYIVYKVKNDSDKGKKKYSGSSTTTSASYSLSDTHIFLPASGCRYDSSFYNVGSSGYYWSSSLDTDYSDYACNLIFYSDGVDWSYYYRGRGRSVRAVCP